MKIKSRHYRIVAIVLAAIILSTSIPLTIWGFGEKSTMTMDNASSEDKRIASEISNGTGVSIEEVFLLKSNGRSWNDVLSVLKNKSNLGANSEKNNRDDLLINSGLDEEFIAKLKKEGFSQDNITEVKMLEERVVFQLQEITSSSKTNQVTQNTQAPQANMSNKSNQVNIEEPRVDIIGSTNNNNNDNKDIFSYEELAKKIDIKNAIYFMLKLKADFGSYEKVFDEYLYSLQADLDLNEYIKDKKAYLESKEEKKLLLDQQKVITLEKIEEKSIQKTQKENNLESEVSAQKNDKTANTAASGSVSKDKSPLPDVPNPNSENVKPQNPTDEVMNEIKEINPIKN